MGIVSNGGASVILVAYGVSGAWSSWGPLAQIYMWFSTAVTAVIAIALFWFKDRSG